MTDRIVIPFGPEILVLTEAEFSVARDRGRAMAMPSLQPSAAPALSDVDLLSADQAALRFSLPKSWLLEKARQSVIPHRRIGRYVRFSPGELSEYLAKSGAIAARSNGHS
jgi:hypothetical protein